MNWYYVKFEDYQKFINWYLNYHGYYNDLRNWFRFNKRFIKFHVKRLNNV